MASKTGQVKKENQHSLKNRIKNVFEQKCFEDPITQEFFAVWASLYENIVTHFVSPDVWEYHKDTIFKQREEGGYDLYIPKNAGFLEMVRIMKAIDEDTFQNMPESNTQIKELEELGKKFRQAGIYLAKRLVFIKSGKDIAANLSEEFYSYGTGLEAGKISVNGLSAEEIANKEFLTPEEDSMIDEWLLGGKFCKKTYARLQRRTGQSKLTDELLEEERRRKLRIFFQAIKHKGYIGVDKKEAWKLHEGPFQHLLEKSFQGIEKAGDMPKTELMSSMVRRGEEKLMREMILAGKKIAEMLPIRDLKSKLEDVRKTGNKDKIAEVEKEIVSEVHCCLNSPELYNEQVWTPMEMIRTHQVNCLGASSLLGGKILEEIGIPSILASIPDHSVLVYTTTNGQVYLEDMVSNWAFTLMDKNLKGTTISEIIHLIKYPEQRKILCESLSENFLKIFPWIKEEHRQPYIIFYPREIGIKQQTLINLADKLRRTGNHRIALAAAQASMDLHIDDFQSYYIYGIEMNYLNKKTEAVEIFQKGIRANPNNLFLYIELGNTLADMGKMKESLDVLNKAVALNPDNPVAYKAQGDVLLNFGFYEDAINAYTNAISKSDMEREKDSVLFLKSLIKSAEQGLEKSYVW